jgi:hypothetical protein
VQSTAIFLEMTTFTENVRDWIESVEGLVGERMLDVIATGGQTASEPSLISYLVWVDDEITNEWLVWVHEEFMNEWLVTAKRGRNSNYLDKVVHMEDNGDLVYGRGMWVAPMSELNEVLRMFGGMRDLKRIAIRDSPTFNGWNGKPLLDWESILDTIDGGFLDEIAHLGFCMCDNFKSFDTDPLLRLAMRRNIEDGSLTIKYHTGYVSAYDADKAPHFPRLMESWMRMGGEMTSRQLEQFQPSMYSFQLVEWNDLQWKGYEEIMKNFVVIPGYHLLRLRLGPEQAIVTPEVTEWENDRISDGVKHDDDFDLESIFKQYVQEHSTIVCYIKKWQRIQMQRRFISKLAQASRASIWDKVQMLGTVDVSCLEADEKELSIRIRDSRETLKEAYASYTDQLIARILYI